MSTESGASALLDQRLDPDGYLRDHLQWSRPIAQQLAARAHIDLTNEHWRIIDLLRTITRAQTPHRPCDHW